MAFTGFVCFYYYVPSLHAVVLCSCRDICRSVSSNYTIFTITPLLYSASRSRSEPSVSHYTSPFIHHHSSERIGGDGPLRSPPFMIIWRCPGLLSSQVCRLIRGHPLARAAPWSSRLLSPARMRRSVASNSTDAWRASCSGVPSGRRLTCPKPSVVDDRTYTCTSGRRVFAASHELQSLPT